MASKNKWRVRTFWQRFSLDNYSKEPTLRPDYMGNAEYEFGSFPAARAKVGALGDALTVRTVTDLPFDIEYYPYVRKGETALDKPTQFTFIGAAQDIDECLAALDGHIIDNKAGLLQSGRDSATLVWMVVDSNACSGGGYLVLNDSWIDELGLRDMVMEFVTQYFNITLPA